MNILIVDDGEYDALELSSKIMKINSEATVTWLSSPDQAFDEISRSHLTPYDIVFVDQYMPGCLGTDLVQRLGGVMSPKSTKLIILTSDGGDSTRSKALVSDCDGFLTKPVDTARLRAFMDGSRCQWEPSDLPHDIENYWTLLASRKSHAVGSPR